MKKVLTMSLLFIMMIPLTGCWNRMELNELAIAVGLAIDKVKENEYMVSVQVVDPSEVAPKQGSTGRSPVTRYRAKADTIFEALRKITTVSPRQIYLAHLRILVIGESVAKEGVAKSLEMLSRDHEVRSDFYIVLARNIKAEQILKYLSPIEKIPSQKMSKSLEVSQSIWAPTRTVQMDQLIADMTSDGKSGVLTGVKYTGNKKVGQSMANVEKSWPEAQLQYTGIAVLKKDKLVGWLNEEESKGLNYVLGDVKNTVGSIKCPKGGSAVIEIFHAKPNVKVTFQNGKPAIHIHNFIEENVGEVRCDIDLSTTEGIKALEKSSEQTNETIIKDSVKRAKQLRADIFGFGEAIHRASPKAWKSLKKDWYEKGLVELPVTVHTTVKIRRTGTTGNSFVTELKE